MTAVTPAEGHARDSQTVTVGLCAAGEIWGGVELAVRLLAAGLRGHGIQTVAMLFHEGLLAEKLRQDGIPVVVLRLPHRYSLATAEIASEVRKRGINLLHLHGYKAGVVGGIAAARLRLPMVKTEHGGVEAPGDWREVAGWMRLMGYRAVDRAITRRVASAIVAVSSPMASALSQRPGSRVCLIHNGIYPQPERFQRRRGPGVRLGIVGRLTAVKGHAILIRAIQHLHDPQLAVEVMGTGPREAEYRRLVSDGGLQRQITFKGFCSDIAGTLRELDALVMPSLNEGLPFALLEAMGQGLPVIASGVGGICDVVEHGVSGLLVPPGDPVALSDAIARIRDDERLACRLGQAARERIEMKFHARRMVEEHVNLYRTVLGQHQATGAS